ncbi:MAG: hypothetical protein ACOY0T_19740 [Myxococcota bacterium]
MMHETLRGLRDVEGVFGSFVLSGTGQLFAKDLPAVFHDDVFTDTGPRVLRLCEAIERGGESLEGLVLRFADYRLHVRRSKERLLCVIANVDTNAAALRMALGLAATRVASATAGELKAAPARTA